MSAERPGWPDFLLIGAAKCGTTTLAMQLASHPGIFVTDPKEPAWFAGFPQFDQQGYQELYADAGDRLRGEASTHYSRIHTFPGTADRIQAAVPDARIVFAIREPVERAISHVEYRLRTAQTEGTAEAILARNDDYLLTSCYGLQLAPYVERFGMDRIHVLRMEDLQRDPQTELERIFAFLGVDTSHRVDTDLRANSRPSSGSRRPIRVPSLVRRLGRVVPSAWKKRLKLKLTRRAPAHELEVSEATREAMRVRFREDFVLLRKFVGPELDLYGYA